MLGLSDNNGRKPTQRGREAACWHERRRLVLNAITNQKCHVENRGGRRRRNENSVPTPSRLAGVSNSTMLELRYVSLSVGNWPAGSTMLRSGSRSRTSVAKLRKRGKACAMRVATVKRPEDVPSRSLISTANPDDPCSKRSMIQPSGNDSGRTASEGATPAPRPEYSLSGPLVPCQFAATLGLRSTIFGLPCGTSCGPT